MTNRHRGTDTDRAMRSRQIEEALGEDARARQKAFLLNFPFVQQSREQFLRPDELDRKTAFELSGFLDKMASSLSQAVSAMAIDAERGKLTQGISEYLSGFNRATAYVRLYGRTGKLSSREEQAIQEKFDGLKPSLEQILNAHAAGTPIPEFRAVLESYDNILNNDLRPVSFSPPLDIPQPAQPAPLAGQPAALPAPPIVGRDVPRPRPAQPPDVGAPAQPAPAPPAPVAPREPPPDVPAYFFNQFLALDRAGVNPNPQAERARQNNIGQIARAVEEWTRDNRPDIQGANARETNFLRFRYINGQLADYVAGRLRPYEQYQADLGAFNQPPPAQQQAPAPPPVAPQQPAQEQREEAISRANRNLIRELEGNRLAVAAAEAALQGQPQNRQRREALDTAQRKFRRAEERAIRAGVVNIQYDPAMGAPKPPRVGDGAYGSASGVVSADMAGMDDEYLDLMLHDGFQDRGNFTGMMKALQQMPTAPFGAGMEMEEGEEMPYGTVGSAKRVAFLPDADYVSDEQENDEEYDDDNFYSREMAGRQQLDDDAEKIQANRLSKELKTAKGSAKNMREMLDKLRGKIKCR